MTRMICSPAVHGGAREQHHVRAEMLRQIDLYRVFLQRTVLIADI